MPDTPGQRDAIQGLRDAIFNRWAAATEDAAETLAQRFPGRRNLVAAWRLPAVLSEAPHDLLVAVDRQFPWSLPIVALPDAVNGISYPHVEVDGHLCLAPVGSAYVLPVGIDHVTQLVAEATDVIAKGRAAENDDDFYAEAQSYWSLISRATASVWLAAAPPATHATWASAVDGGNFVVAPSKQALLDWANAGERRLVGAFEPALVVRLPEPLHPRDYPLTMKELASLIERAGAAQELQAALSRWHARRELPVVLVFSYDGDDVCLGATFLSPRQVRMPGARHNGIPGFRHNVKGRTNSRRVALSMVPTRFPHLQVTPVYRSFLHTRTAGLSAGPLVRVHVIIAGCGALGGQLAVQLAQAGVGRLTLLDQDLMTWQNVGRHVLDSSAVGQFKAKALEKAIRRRFPDAAVSGIAGSWEDYLNDRGDALNSADLMISVTGDAASNRHLDECAAAGDVPAVLFGWIEPFGVAAHALFCQPGARRLADISDEFGRLTEPVADVQSAPALPREPACGAFYQPYSSLSALPSIALLGELAVDVLLGRVSTSIHRVWVGGPDEFSRNGLSVHPAWHSRLNNLGYNKRFDLIL